MPSAQREAILVAALEVFAERGYRGASFDAIAERAGLTRQGVLHYFPSKRKLLLAILRYREELSREHLAENQLQDWPSLVAEVVAYDHLTPALAQVHGVLLAESMIHGDDELKLFHEHYVRLREHMAERFTEQYGERLPSGLTPRAAATAVLVLVDGLQQHWLLDREKDDYPDVMRDVLSVLLGSTPA